jgi:hypothetical protein
MGYDLPIGPYLREITVWFHHTIFSRIFEYHTEIVRCIREANIQHPSGVDGIPFMRSCFREVMPSLENEGDKAGPPNSTDAQFVCGQNDLRPQHNYRERTS